MSIGEKTRVSHLGDVPENFIIKNYDPQTEVLKYAKLFITHGGMNSVYESLYYGVPLIVIPLSADQPVIANQVAKIGAGIQLQMSGLTANQLHESVDHVLNQSTYHQAATKMKEFCKNRLDISRLLMRFLNLKDNIISKRT